MAPSLTRIFDVADATRHAIEAGFATAGVDLPERRYVNNGGRPPLDCEQLAVCVERTFGVSGDVTAEVLSVQPQMLQRAARLGIWLVRCVPTIKTTGQKGIVPSVEEIEGSALELLSDAQLLLNVLQAARKAKTLGCCKTMAFEGWEPYGPEGGLGGGVLRVRMGLDELCPEGS